MKTILIPTDFSTAANHAAAYGLKLAERLKSNVLLCHADKDAPVDAPSTAKLVMLASSLEKTKDHSPAGNFVPLIKVKARTGTVAGVANILSEDAPVSLIIMGTSGTGRQQKGFMGRDSHDMIDSSRLPLLLVPPPAANRLPRKIGFATDLDEKDIPILYSLATLARDLQAGVVIVHIDAGCYDHEARKNQWEHFLEKVCKDIPFITFSYSNIESNGIAAGLNHVVADASIDMLAMSHNRHRQLESLLDAGNSYTIEMARNLRIPLLVYPKDMAAPYPVF